MKQFVRITLLTLGLSSIAFVQRADYELRLERQINTMSDKERLSYLSLLLNLPASTPVKLVKNKKRSLRNKSSLKIYLTPEANRSKGYFETAIRDWNQKHVAQFRTLEIVAAAWQADIVIARFMDREWGRVEYERHGPGS